MIENFFEENMYYFVMKINQDNEEYQIDPKKLLMSYDHMLNDVIQQSVIKYQYENFG
jgi:hypothetical protein